MYQINKNKNKEKGVALIIMFFVMIVIVAAVLSVSSLLFSEIKMIRSISSSVIGFYAADSGIEKVLYYDRKVFPEGVESKRGLCAMCALENPTCSGNGNDNDGLTCACETPFIIEEALAHPTDYPGASCDVDKCKFCNVSFSTTFGSINNKKTYRVEAIAGGTDYATETVFQADALGTYNGVSRAINILVGAGNPF
jgi:hypothetical protein